jgi:hypothetical protein
VWAKIVRFALSDTAKSIDGATWRRDRECLTRARHQFVERRYSTLSIN